MSDAYPFRIGFEDALRVVRETGRERRLPVERVALARARGRILARDLVAPIALPSFDNAAMDGFAVRAEDAASAADAGLRLAGEQFAGRAQALRVGAGEAVRITTGAALPEGADAVLMKENARVEGERVVALSAPVAGTHVRRAGEDVAAGDLVLRAGELLNPARLALAAALGMPELEVAARPTVAVFTTGDELRRPGETLARGEIYDSNRVLLMGLLADLGLEPMALPALPDDPVRMQAALTDAAGAFDLVITCGGVSAGEKDHLPALLEANGRIRFWKVRMKPGMPVLFGDWDQACILGLPGNPVSVLATFLTLGRSLVDAMQGRSEAAYRLRARLAAPWEKRHERLEFLRGCLQPTRDGSLIVHANPADGSHRMRAAADSDALIVLEEGARRYEAGAIVDVLRY